MRYDLIPADALEELAQVYTMGAQKYAERNWEKGMPWSKCFASLMRHAWSFWKGETHDTESGLHHMSHVAWNAMTLVSYTKRNVGEDNRPS